MKNERRTERNEIEESDHTASENGPGLEEVEGEEGLSGCESFVGDEREKDDTSEDEENDDLVAVPIESTLVDEIERKEKASPSSTE